MTNVDWDEARWLLGKEVQRVAGGTFTAAVHAVDAVIMGADDPTLNIGASSLRTPWLLAMITDRAVARLHNAEEPKP